MKIQKGPIFSYFVTNTLLTITMNNLIKDLPKWFWVLGVLALFWNLLGVMAYIDELIVTKEELKGYDEYDRYFYEVKPFWVKIAYTISVFGGTLGSVALLMRSKTAILFFILSFLGILILQSFILFFTDAIALFGTNQLAFPVMIFLVGMVLVILSTYANKREWLV
ncbi:MAG: hypothetical protein WBB24_18340 [Maribacter sp.]